MFGVFAQKSIYVYDGVTSEKYENRKEGEVVIFDEHCIQNIKARFTQIDAISPEVSGSYVATAGRHCGNYHTVGVNDDYMRIKILKIKDEGRNINKADIIDERNIAIIGENAANGLFPNYEPLGKYLDIESAEFKVVGIFKMMKSLVHL